MLGDIVDDDLIYAPLTDRLGPMSRLAIAWTLGCVLGWWVDRPALWLAIALSGLIIALILSFKHRPLSALAWGLVITACQIGRAHV